MCVCSHPQDDIAGTAWPHHGHVPCEPNDLRSELHSRSSPGDRLIRIGNLQTQNATWGAIYNAMHGKPGQTLILVLERSGNRFTVTAKVTAF